MAMELSAEERAERRRRRREALGRRLDSSVPSPCVSVCTLDPVSDICIGCLRTVDEIREWPILSAEEKRRILAALEERRRGTPQR
jgi:predicted Fe-S protein YdhL (DUF1289 family)